MKNKKSSLQLSINAIVVLILAITLLGLGLAFIKDKFGGAVERLYEVDLELEAQIIEDLESSGEIVTLKQKEFEVESGSPTEFYMGIRNTESTAVTYYIQFMCDQGMSTGLCINDATDDASGKDEFYDNSGDKQWTWFNTFSKIQIAPGKGKAILVRLQASGGADIYKGRIAVWKCTLTDQTACSDPTYQDTAVLFGTAPVVAVSDAGPNTDPVAVEKITLKIT